MIKWEKQSWGMGHEIRMRFAHIMFYAGKACERAKRAIIKNAAQRTS